MNLSVSKSITNCVRCDTSERSLWAKAGRGRGGMTHPSFVPFGRRIKKAALAVPGQKEENLVAKLLGFGVASAFICWVPAFSALAQGADPQATGSGQLEDIVVTAQRKTERLQDVPISVSAVTSAQMATRGIVTSESITTSVPGLEYTIVGPTATPYLRGIGAQGSTPNAEASVATYIDGVYQPFAGANMAGFNNVERIEVLKGPQGTLFGRNATGGVIQIITKKPSLTDTAADMTLGYDNYRTLLGSMYASTPLSEKVAINLAVSGQNQGRGWGRNTTTGEEVFTRDEISIRPKLLFAPGENTEIVLTGEYRKFDLKGFDVSRIANGARALDGTPSAPNRYDMEGNTRGFLHVKQFSGSLNITHDLGGVRFVSISSIARTRHISQEDIDTSPASILDFYGPTHQRNMSQEFQLTSTPGSPIDWVGGVYLYYNRAGYAGAFYTGIVTAEHHSFQTTKSAAIYAQATAEVITNLKATAGIRYNADWQKVNGRVVGGPEAPVPGAIIIPQTRKTQSAKKPTWRLALDYSFTRDVHAYVSYNRGVKSGGFALLSITDPGYKPETVDAYEVGFKSELFDRRLRFNASAFLYNFKDIQVEVTPAGQVFTLNAAKARIKGFEVEATAVPVENLTLTGSFTYIHGRYLEFPNAPYNPNSGLDPNPFPGGFDAAGKETLQTPKNSASLSADYVIPSSVGDFTVSATFRYYDDISYNVFADFVRPSYTQVNTNLSWRSTNEKLGAAFFVRNLTKKYSTAQGVATGLGWLVSPTAPRTIGASVTLKY